jgi:phosphate/sulfate permease
MIHRPRMPRLADTCGSVLLEVVLATLLVGILVVPLATALGGAVAQTRAARLQIAGAGAQNPSLNESTGWEWGPRVIAGWWRPGPILHVKVAGGVGDAIPTSTWAFGWTDG